MISSSDFGSGIGGFISEHYVKPSICISLKWLTFHPSVGGYTIFPELVWRQSDTTESWAELALSDAKELIELKELKSNLLKFLVWEHVIGLFEVQEGPGYILLERVLVMWLIYIDRKYFHSRFLIVHT
jgi:hypothetical protein